MKVALIGDLHGNHLLHRVLMAKYEYTLQIGDCGVDYAYMGEYNPTHHKVLGGNHDNYPLLTQLPHYLGDFGTWMGMFYVHGAWSIDQAQRIVGKDWWAEEELSVPQCDAALAEYIRLKPMLVVTHEGPSEATAQLESLFPGPRHETRTGMLLSAMLKAHAPMGWYFGHWHQSKVSAGGDTTFRCIGINEVAEVDIGSEPTRS